MDLARTDPLSTWLVPHAAGALAPLVAQAGDTAQAAALAKEAVDAARELRVRPIVAMALTRAAETAVLSGSAREGVPAIVEVLAILTNLGSERWFADALELTAVALEDGGRPAEAAVTLGAADGLRAAGGGDVAGRLLGPLLAATRDRLHAALGPETFGDELARGAQLAPQAAVALALSTLTGGR